MENSLGRSLYSHLPRVSPEVTPALNSAGLQLSVGQFCHYKVPVQKNKIGYLVSGVKCDNTELCVLMAVLSHPVKPRASNTHLSIDICS